MIMEIFEIWSWIVEYNRQDLCGQFGMILTLSWWRSLSYRGHSFDLLCKSMDWLLNDTDLRNERVNSKISSFIPNAPFLYSLRERLHWERMGQNWNHLRLLPSFYASWRQKMKMFLCKKSICDTDVDCLLLIYF